MKLQYYGLSVFIVLVPLLTAQCHQPENPCRYYYEKLKDLPHEKLDLHEGTITFLWDRKEYKGCEVVFTTHDSLLNDSYKLPQFAQGLDPVLEEQGWRYNNNYTADGPGSMAYGIENQIRFALYPTANRLHW